MSKLDVMHPALKLGNIAHLEMLAVLVACELWAQDLCGRHVRILVDNMAVQQVLNSGAAKDPFLLHCLRLCLCLPICRLCLRLP